MWNWIYENINRLDIWSFDLKKGRECSKKRKWNLIEDHNWFRESFSLRFLRWNRYYDVRRQKKDEFIALEAGVGGEKRRRRLSKISCQATMLQKSARSLHSVQVDASSIYRRVRLKNVGQENWTTNKHQVFCLLHEIACLMRVFLNQRSPPLFVDKKCKSENDASRSASQKMIYRNRFERWHTMAHTAVCQVERELRRGDLSRIFLNFFNKRRYRHNLIFCRTLYEKYSTSVNNSNTAVWNKTGKASTFRFSIFQSLILTTSTLEAPSLANTVSYTLGTTYSPVSPRRPN